MTSPTPFVDGYRLIDGTELNAVTANPQWSISPAVTATAGGSLTNSIRLTDTLSVVSVASVPNAGVVLPPARSGVLRVVQNAAANQIVVYSQGGSTVDGLPGNIGQTIDAGLTYWFVGTSVNSWAVMLKTLPTPASTAGTLAQFAATTSAQLAGVITDETGTGSLVFANTPSLTSPQLTTPALGTPTSGTLTNCTGLPVATGVSGLGTGVASALAVNVGTAGAPVVNGGALGTPQSGTLTNCTNLPISTGVSGLGAGVATFLATPSSANLASAVTGETGSGALVFGTAPSLSGVNLAAGTNSVAPINMVAGTNLTTATAGAVEYDGKVAYITPQGTQRGIVPNEQYFRLNADLAGANVNTAQNVFGVAVTLSSATVYAFEIIFAIRKTAGTTSHTVSLGMGGTATLNNILYAGWTNFTTAASPIPGLSAPYGDFISNSAANLLIVAAQTSATLFVQAKMSGTVSVNVGGTFFPQYTLSAAPGGAYSTIVGSYMRIYPIGAAGANVSVGTWA